MDAHAIGRGTALDARAHPGQAAQMPGSRAAAALDERADPAVPIRGSDWPLDRAAPWLLAALLTVGTLLRVLDIGQLSFRWDEDLSSLAAKAIAAHGIPELPSGMIYLRSLPFLYVLAGSGMLFGFDEWSLRLPAALFGIATIALGYFFGKRLFGTSVGLVVAALLTFSAWDVEFARYARMYTPFAFFYVLTLLSIWRYLVVERSTAGGVLCLVLALTALSLHDLAYTLALAFLLPLLIDGRQTLEQPRRAVLPLAGFVSVASAFFVWGRIQSRYYDRAAHLAAERGAADVGAIPEDLALRTLEGTGGDGGPLGLLSRILAQVRLPDLPAFEALFQTMPLAAAGIPVLALIAAAAFVAVRRPMMHPAASALLPLIALLGGFQLFNLALLATAALAFVRREGVRAFRSPEVVFAIVLVASTFTVWFAAIVGLDLLGVGGGILATAKEAIRQLLNYPSFFVVWGFPREYPLTSLAALIGALWAFERIAKPQPDRAALFLAAAFALPILLNGMFETRYQNFRYNVPFGTLFFTFVALGLVKWPELLRAWHGSPGRPLEHRRAPARGAVFAGTALLAMLIAAYDMNPIKSWLVTSRDHSSQGSLYAFFDLRGFRDFRNAAQYVGARADADDALITFDCREYYNYLDRMDYCIVSGTYRSGDELIQTYVDDGVIKDLYVGSTMIFDVEDLERVLAQTPGDAWLLASDSIFHEGRYPKDVLEFLAKRQHQVVHVARDGMTKVYRF